ncbi:MAG: hypothetical protein HRU70_00140 [Phycisphaeraceae bacterium]|nr:MAG: hypothetical protein HRU70_00140 [Phycisphaeraceae bacterium]
MTQRLESGPAWVLALWAMAASFSAYFCMYAYRKPFAAAGFEGESFFGSGVGLKTALVIGQIVGYTISKFMGIKVCSEMGAGSRGRALMVMILAAQGALLAFALLPGSWKVAAMCLNGLPLGMVWGVAVSYLEGRRASEVMLAGLSCSYIVASGVVKDAGIGVMRAFGTSEAWMPFVTGALFLPAFAVSVWMLERLPPPTARDIEERTRRAPMMASERWAFLTRFLPGMVMLLGVYFLLTAYRDFRDNYGVEVFRELGYGETPGIFTRTEVPVAFGVMGCLALISLARSNRVGIGLVFLMMTAGVVLMGAATLAFDGGRVSGAWWMTLVGLGAYMAYVPFGSVLFDRLIASTRVVGTAVFAIYVFDAVGYTGSVGVQLFKDLGASSSTRLEFFRGLTYAMSGVGVVLLGGAYAYFAVRHLRGGAGRG